MSRTLGLLGLFRLTILPRHVGPDDRASPHPTERLRLIPHEEVDLHRNLACARYEGCLDEAYQRAWRSWSCQRCARFAPRRRPALLRHGPRRLRLQLAGGVTR